MRKNYGNGHYYHVYNRGVNKQRVFRNDHDREFFVKRMFDFERGISGAADVKIIAYCLMGNHYHILVRQESEGGISRFMQRLGTSYMMRWNKVYDWSGRLFQGPFKCRHINSDSYLAHVIRYIHMNPLGDRAKTAFSRGELSSAIKYLGSYRWSDCNKYLTQRGVLSSLFDPMLYKKFLEWWMLWPSDDDMQGLA